MKIRSKFHDLMGAFRVTRWRKNAIKHASSKPSEEVDHTNEIAQELHPSEKLHLELIAIKDIGKQASLFRFKVEERIPYFRAGQYLTLDFTLGDTKCSRPYSICSAPESTLGEHPFVEIAVKRLKEGGFASNYLLDIADIGDRFTGRIGLGEFYIDPLRDSKNLVLLAGGSGITPFLSMIREEKLKPSENHFTLLYACNEEQEILLRRELTNALSPEVKIVYVLKDKPREFDGEAGLLSKETIAKYAGEDPTYFVCGPAGMVSYVLGQLREMNVPQRRIRVEKQGLPKDPRKLEGYPEGNEAKVYSLTVVQGVEETKIQARGNEPILVAMERAGILVRSQCRVGECSSCRVKLLEGSLFVPEEFEARRMTDKELGWYHSCVSYPLSDCKIKVPIL